MAVQGLDLPRIYGAAAGIQNAQKQNQLLDAQLGAYEQDQARTQQYNSLLSGVDFGGGLAANAPQIGQLFALDPSATQGVVQMLSSMDEAQRVALQQENETIIRALAPVLENPTTFDAAIADLNAKGIDTTGLSLENVEATIMEHADMDTIMSRVFPDPTTAMQEYEFAQKQGFGGTFEEWKNPPAAPSAPTPYTDAARAASDLANGFITQEEYDRITAPGDEPLDPKDVFTFENNLRDDYEARSKDFFAIEGAYEKLVAASSAPSAAGDIALLVGFMKLIDPGSVVRENEFATAQNAAGVPERIRSTYNRLVSGERLTPEQRADFVGQAEKLYGAALEAQKGIDDLYTGIANRSGVDPANVITRWTGTEEPSGDEMPLPPAPAQEDIPVRVDGVRTGMTSPEGHPVYMRSDGTFFAVAPDGSVAEAQ